MLFNRKKFFAVYEDEAAPKEENRIQLVPNGFSFLGFIFTFLWAAYHSIWKVAIIFLILVSAVQGLSLEGLLNMNQASGLQFVLSLWFGFSAYDWLEHHYEKKGLSLVDIVFAQNKDDAEHIFLSREYYTPETQAAALNRRQ